MNPPPGRVDDGVAESEDPWEAVVSGRVELDSGNPEVVDGTSVVVRDPVRLVLKLTGSDVVVLNQATVVVFVRLENGAAVVLGAATFVLLNPGVAVIVIVVAVVVLVTRTVRTEGVLDLVLLVRETDVELEAAVEEVRELLVRETEVELGVTEEAV